MGANRILAVRSFCKLSYISIFQRIKAEGLIGFSDVLDAYQERGNKGRSHACDYV